MKSIKRLFLTLGLLTTLTSLGVSTAQAQTPPTRILPLGDSLTSGVSGQVVNGGYRNRLYTLLTNAGYNVDFIGLNTDASNPTLPDRDHQGVGGIRIDTVQASINDWLDAMAEPDVVLLLLGTNDFSQNFNINSIQTRMNDLISAIAVKRPFAKIIVSNLTVRTDSAILDAQEAVFSAAIPGIVNTQVALGRQVSFLDIRSGILTSDLSDGVHPTQTGYNKMADLWFPAITNVISPLGTSNPPVVVNIGPPTTLQQVTVKFSKPLADAAASAANFSINNGVAVTQATLDAATKRIMTLTTSPQTPGTLYTLAVSGIRDRTLQQNPIAPGTSVAFAVDLHANGSFELDLASWTSSGNVEIKNGSPYIATSGTKLLAFNTGQLPANGVLSQSFPTVVGSSYALAFDAGAFGATTEQRLRVQVVGSGSLVNQTVSITGPGSNTRWVPQVFGFVANSTTTTMTFTDVSPTNLNIDLLLDNVRLTPQIPRTLTVSSLPSSGITIGVSPPDLNGASGSNTGFSRQYANGSIVTLTAPATVGLNNFSKWQRNGVDFTTNVNATVTLDGNYTLNAVYVSSNQLLVNGSFETGSFAPWTTSGGTANSIALDGALPSTDGTRIVKFNSANSPAGGIISQTFPTTPGTSYGLSFDQGVLAYNTAQQRLLVTVTGTGNLLSQTTTINGINNGTVKWEPKSFSFVANSNSTTLTFTDTSTVTSAIDGLLDNVKVTGPAAPLNASPVGIADSYSVAQNNALVVPAAGVLTNDTDAETNPLTAILATLPSSGSVVLNSNGGFTYTPNSGFAGTDSFTYRANDGISDSNSTTVTIMVNGIASGALTNGSFESGESGWTMTGNRLVYPTTAPYNAIDGTNMLLLNSANGAPNAVVSQTFSTTIGQNYELIFNIGMLSFGSTQQRLQVDVTGAASLVSQSVTLTGNGQGNSDWTQRTYPFTATSATTTVTFTDTSPTTFGADLLLDNARVRIAVPNTAPVAVANSYSTTVGTSLIVPAAGVLTNDTDAELDTLTAVLGTGPTSGNLTLNPNGGFTYIPNPTFSGMDSFTYRANDGSLNSNFATVSITVSSPQALLNGSFESDETGWTMSGNRAVIEASGPYTPSNGLKFLVMNGGNSQPDAVISQAFNTVVGQTYTLSFQMGILAGNTAEQKLQVDVVGSTPLLPATVETLTGNGLGNTVWTPKTYTFTADNASTTLTFTDVSTTSSIIDLLLDDVSVVPASSGPPNTAPVAVADSYTTGFNTALVVPVLTGVLANDTDAELSPLTAAVVAPSSGNLTLNPNGSFTYTPTPGFSGSDSFTYRANDGSLNSNTVTVSITVSPSFVGLVNGSFESTFTGWITSGNTTTASGAFYAPTNGLSVATFNGANSTPNGVISQAFTTVPGTSYTLAFDAGNFSYNTSPQTLQVTVDGTGNLLTQVVTVNGLGNGTSRWVPQSFSFVANSTSTTLTFRDQSTTTGGLDLLLDNVQVTSAGAPTNTAPVAAADTYSTNVDTQLLVAAAGVLSNDTDAQSNPLTAVVVTPPSSGTLVLAPNGGFTYTPATGFTGVVTFTYRANDGSLDSNVATATVNVGNSAVQLLVNGSFESNYTGWTPSGNTRTDSGAFLAPTNGTIVATFNAANSTPNGTLAQTFPTVPGTTYTLEFDAGNFSYNNNPQTLQVTVDGTSNLLTQVVNITGLGNGITRWAAQSFTFVANSNSTTLTFRDQSTTTAGLDLLLDNVRVTGAGVATNTAPVAVADTYSTNMDAQLVVAAAGVLGNDTDAQSNPLTAVVVTPPASGTLNLATNGGFTYTPATGFTGVVTFTYRANDGSLDSNIATSTITVGSSPVQVLVNGSFETAFTGWTVTGNTSVATSDSLSPTNGVSLAAFNDGNRTPNAVVSQSFTTVPGTNYTLEFDAGNYGYSPATQTVQVTVDGSSNLLTQVVTINGGGNGTTRWVAQRFTFVANSASTTLTFRDQSGTSAALDLLLDNVRVTGAGGAPNTAPVAVADSYSTTLNTQLVVAAAGVLGNDTDAQSNPLTAALVVAPASGTLNLNSNGGFTYTPATGFIGNTSFTYRANDGIDNSNIVTVSITVTPISTGAFANGSFEADEANWTMSGNRLVYTSLAPYTAIDGSKLLLFNSGNSTPNAVVSQTFNTVPGTVYTLAYQVGTLGGPANEQKLQMQINGSAPLLPITVETVAGDNSSNVIWTPKSYSFTADSTVTTLTFTDITASTFGADLLLDQVRVAPFSAPAAPVAVADSYTAVQSTTLVVPANGVLANDTDANLDPLTVAVVAPPTNGSLTLNPNGGFSYTPTGFFSGVDSFTYRANDGTADSNTVTVTITVTAPQVLVNGSFESGESGWAMTGSRVVIPSQTPYLPSNGTNFLVLNGGGNPANGVISQTFGTVPGQPYSLSYDVGVYALNTATQTLQLSINGAAALITPVVENFTGNGLGNSVYLSRSLVFTADSAATTISFSDLSTTTAGIDLLLDNVSVTGTPGGPVNASPVAVAESYSTNRNVTLVVPVGSGVLVNDTDPETNPLTAVRGTGPSNGTLNLNSNGSFSYIPNSGYSGPDSFTYSANDGFSNSNPVTVSITVNATFPGLVNGSFESGFTGWTTTGNTNIGTEASPPPTQGVQLARFNGANTAPNGVVSQSFTSEIGTTYNVAFDAGVWGFNTNAQRLQFKVDGSSNLITQVITINSLSGGLTRWVPQTFSFVANSTTTVLTFTDQSTTTAGLDLILDNVRVTTGNSASNTAPVAVAESYGTNVNTQLVVAAASGVLANDTDAQLDPLTAILGTGPSSGTLSLNPNGGFTYTPATGFTGNVTFTYRANDGALDSNLVTVTIGVSPQLVVNGGFESVFAGWTISGAITTEAGAAYAPTEGTKVFGYNSAQEPNNGVISQAIPTVVGQTYTLSLDVGALSFNLNTLPQVMGVGVTGASPLINELVSVNGLGFGTATWVSRSYTFVANSTSTTLRFSDQSLTTQNTDLLIDNVRVTLGGSSTNTAPVAVADNTTSILNTPLVVPVAAGVLANDADAQGNTLTASLVSGTTSGNLTLNPNGSFTYTPNTGFTGTDSFTYRANDGSLNSNVATVTINTIPAFIGLLNGGFEQVFANWNISGAITIEAGAPYAPTEGTKVIGYNSAQEPNNGVISQSFATVAGQTYYLALDVGALSFNGNTQPQVMRIVANGAGNLLNRTATVNGIGAGVARWASQAFSFVADSASTTLVFSDISTFTQNTDLLIDNVRVTPAPSGPNTAPVAVADGYSATTNTPLIVPAFGVLANDTDGESNPLTATLVTAPTNGTFSLASDGGFSYTPPTGFTGTVSFSYRANDGSLSSNVTTATISVGQPLVVNGGFEQVFAGWTISGAITTEAGAAYAPTEGTKVIGYNSAQEPNNGVISQVIPTVVGQTYTLALDIGALSFNLNTSPQVMRVGVTGATPLISQTVSVNGLGFGTATWVSRSFAFLANSTSTTIRFSDESLTTQNTDLLIDNVRVTLGGSTVNTPPSANTDVYTAFLNAPLVVPATGVLLNDADAQGLPLTAAIVGNPTNGNVTLNANGGFTYTPGTGFLGTDSFTYRANDGLLDSNTATVTINVLPGFVGLLNGSFEQIFANWNISGAITIEGGAAYAPTDGTLVTGYNSAQTPNNGVISQTIATTTGQTYRLTLDVGALSFNGNTSPQVMRIAANGVGSLLNRTATVNGVGNGFARWVPQVFSFTADGPSTTLVFSDISTTTANIDLLIDNVRVIPAPAGPNTAPVAVADSYVINRNTTLTVPGRGVMTNDTDADSNPIVASLVSGPTSGTLSFSQFGSFTYTPANNFTGTASFTYRVNDGVADSNTVTVSIQVSQPLIANGGFETFNIWNMTGAVTFEAGAAYGPTEGTKVFGFNSAQAPNDGVVSQAFTTVVGQAYTLLVDVGALSFNAITSPQSMGIEVIGATPLINQTATVNGSGTGFANWATQTFTFIANSTSTTLRFSDRSTTTANIDLLIDNVRVFLGATGPNTAPVAVADAYGTNLNTVLNVAAPGVLGNDSDAQANPLTASVVTGPASGTLNLNPNGGFSYTPATGFTGVASFTYRANDGSLDSNTVTVTLSVNTPGVQVLANPSFETGTFAPWTTTGGTVDSCKVNGLIAGTNGTKIVEFNSANSPAAATLSQTFATIPGTTYSLEFDLGVISFNTNQQRLQVSVTGNSTSLLSQIASINGVNNGTIVWSPRSYSFVANSTSTTLSFTDISPTTAAIDVLLDNVRVTSFPAPQAALIPSGASEGSGTQPEVSSSAVQISQPSAPTMSMSPVGRTLQMTPSAPGKYTLQRTENFETWENVGAERTVTEPGVIEFVDDIESKNSLPAKPRMFYRIRSVTDTPTE
jgi:lysophospholipase L1-like esterase